MSDDFVAHIPDEEIARIALRARAQLLLGETPKVSMIRVLEIGIPQLFPDYELHIDPPEQMGDVEAYVANFPPRTVVSEPVYKAAFADHKRSRFTLAHELGHLLLHLKYLQNADGRSERSNSYNLSFVPRSERQANRFAVHFLMPASIVRRFPDPDRLSAACGVNRDVAERRLEELGLWQRKNDAIKNGFDDLLSRLRSGSQPDQPTAPVRTRTESWGQILYDEEKDQFSAVVRAGLTPKPEAPIGMGWVIIGGCNQECIGCYGNAEELPKGILSNPEFIHIADAISEAGIMRVVISGGEPLLLPALPNVIDRLARKGVSVVLGTNGTFLNSENIKALAQCTRVEISLDAPTPELNNRLRPSKDPDGNAWAEAIRAIELCLAHQIKVRVLTTLNRFNQDELVKLAALLDRIGAKDWAISWTIPAGRAIPIYHQLKPQKEIVDRQMLQVRVYFPSLNVRYSNRGQEYNRFYFLILPDGQIATQDIKMGAKVTFGSALDVPLKSVWNDQNFDLSAHVNKWVAGRITRTYG